MAARTWFTAENTPADADHTTMNRAARMLRDMQGDGLSRAQLMAIRCAWRPGCSASDIVRAVEDAEEYH